MDWYTSTNDDFISLLEADWETLTDGTPSSYEGSMTWEIVQEFEWGLTDESQWQGAGESAAKTPWHIVTISGTISGQTLGEWQIKTVYGEQN